MKPLAKTPIKMNQAEAEVLLAAVYTQLEEMAKARKRWVGTPYARTVVAYNRDRRLLRSAEKKLRKAVGL